MKKLIILVAVSSTFIMCKKGELTTSQVDEAIHSADSTVADAAEKINAVDHHTAEAVFDSANIKIKEFEDTKNSVQEKIESASKSVDSLSSKIASTRLESIPVKKDSAEKTSEKIVINVPAPKIIKQTKIVYKDAPKKQIANNNSVKEKMLKTGILELNVNDAETAKQIVLEEVKKYDGYIRSENISLNNSDNKTAYLKVKVPIQKFEYLMDDLSYNIGEVENKSIEISGVNFTENTLCDLEITLYGKTGVIKNDQPKTFGDRSFAAVSSGWNVIESIFLFILPLWPLFLIAGIGYYFYKKKNADHPNTNN